jgi:hypothetical protein
MKESDKKVSQKMKENIGKFENNLTNETLKEHSLKMQQKKQ